MDRVDAGLADYVASLLLPGGSLSSLRRAGSVGLGLATGIAKAGNRAGDP